MPDFWSAFGDVLWYTLWFAVFIAYLFALFAIIGDLFRDHTLSGWWKAVWIFFLIFFPFITALIYLIARGDGMSKRSMSEAREARAATDDYIRSVAGSPSDEIARAKALLDAGTISEEEYGKLKAKALS